MGYASRHLVTQDRRRFVGATVVCARANPRGITVYDEVCTLEWPVEGTDPGPRRSRCPLDHFFRRKIILE
jgi:hypothetical protein